MRIERGAFNRGCKPYVELLKNKQSIYRTLPYYENTLEPEWNEAADKFVDGLDDASFEIRVKDQIGDEPAARDTVLGAWKGEISFIVGKADFKLPLKQFTIKHFPEEQLPIVGYVFLSFGYSPVEVNVDLSNADGKMS